MMSPEPNFCFLVSNWSGWVKLPRAVRPAESFLRGPRRTSQRQAIRIFCRNSRTCRICWSHFRRRTTRTRNYIAWSVHASGPPPLMIRAISRSAFILSRGYFGSRVLCRIGNTAISAAGSSKTASPPRSAQISTSSAPCAAGRPVRLSWIPANVRFRQLSVSSRPLGSLSLRPAILHG